jgi:DNA-binding XRE family transcriptional regulator
MSKSKQLVKSKKAKSTAWETAIFPRLAEIKSMYSVEGLIDSEVAKRLNVSVSTYDRAKRRDELAEIITLTRGTLSANVEESLYKPEIPNNCNYAGKEAPNASIMSRCSGVVSV